MNDHDLKKLNKLAGLYMTTFRDTCGLSQVWPNSGIETGKCTTFSNQAQREISPPPTPAHTRINIISHLS